MFRLTYMLGDADDTADCGVYSTEAKATEAQLAIQEGIKSGRLNMLLGSLYFGDAGPDLWDHWFRRGDLHRAFRFSINPITLGADPEIKTILDRYDPEEYWK